MFSSLVCSLCTYLPTYVHTFTYTHIYIYIHTYTFTDPPSTQVGLNAEFVMKRAKLQYAIN